jgi:flagellar hook-associated protein 3 FlgL
MRISTAGFNQQTIDLINDQTAQLAITQAHLSSSKRVNSPADDPVAAVHILQLNQALSQTAQYGRNADAANARLSFEDQTLSNVTNVLQRIRDLTVQANSGNNDTTSRNAIATELDQSMQQLMELANTRDSNGEYLFAGLMTQTQPFSQSSTGAVVYSGDQGTRQIQVGQTQKIGDSDNGFSVFQNIPAGNGTFVTNTSQANSGTVSVGSTSVTNLASWVPGTYTITFNTPTTYTITDSSNNTVSTGTYAPGGSITFNGASISLQGTPAANDTVTVSTAGKQDIFSTVSQLAATLRGQLNSPAQNAQYATTLGNTLTQLDQALGHVDDIRATVGTRVNAVATAKSDGQSTTLDLQTSLSQLQDLDYASAIGKLSVQQTGLQAAEAAYSKISQLSLFDYIK